MSIVQGQYIARQVEGKNDKFFMMRWPVKFFMSRAPKGYISGSSHGFEASTLKWSVLHLYLLDEELEYAVGGFVNYGNIVQITGSSKIWPVAGPSEII